MRGIMFQIKNEYGKQLADLLVDIVDPAWVWSIDPVESYKVENDTLADSLFLDVVMDGQGFSELINTHIHYLIFADLKAFPTRESIVEVKNVEDFMGSECQLAFLLTDSVYTRILAKDEEVIRKLGERARLKGFTEIEYLTDEQVSGMMLTTWG
ncbi:DUF2691 family protein [Sporosarcina oncorhynchi]|uniref:DUF2691 family protein n=1 Tax=Sporosarcina oncorhynchi TaxID=3056444 RepID=A0ABZ0L4U3_9BACL|nr:DUF2691 family protein [Sporosarcina sp. T2O-4]WOV87227.1 DUF2691 family protein [Sporosarcina sp. T2O-4]